VARTLAEEEPVTKWLMLAAAIASEVTGSLTLKAALGNPALYAVVAAGYIGSFALLSGVLRLGVPLGVAYGIWAAAGVAATALLSALLFGEPLTPIMGVGLALVIGGVLMVEVGSHRADRHRVVPCHDRGAR
jgi:small multidrug resistance pump